MKISTRLFASACLAVVFGFIGNFGFAQTGPVPAGLAAALQARLDQQRISNNLKGMSASLIIPGHGVWRGVSGVSHGTVPIDTAMVFGIGSITKTFVTATVMQLAEDSLLSLSDSLHNWLPAYPNINPNITIRQLLQHRSGIYNYTNNLDWGNAVNNNFTATWTANQILNNYVLAPTGTPGGQFQYSNTNFLLLGRIIEEVTDSAWWDVLRHRILVPQNLPGIFAAETEAPTGTFPHHWQVLGNGTVFDLYPYSKTAIWTSADAAGNLASNAYDVARFGKLLFEGQILRPSTVSLMTQFSSVAGGPAFNGYGMGIFRINNLGQSVYGHGGNIPGFAAMMIYSPTNNISVSVLTNQDSPTTPFGLAMLQAAQQWITTSAPDLIAAEQPVLFIFPNPATASGTVQFTLAKPGKFTLRLLNVLGQEITVLASGVNAGVAQTVPVNFGGLPAGWYMCRLETDQGTVVKRWLIE